MSQKDLNSSNRIKACVVCFVGTQGSEGTKSRPRTAGKPKRYKAWKPVKDVQSVKSAESAFGSKLARLHAFPPPPPLRAQFPSVVFSSRPSPAFVCFFANKTAPESVLARPDKPLLSSVIINSTETLCLGLKTPFRKGRILFARLELLNWIHQTCLSNVYCFFVNDLT